jgi:type I restriction enzyme S subunit
MKLSKVFSSIGTIPLPDSWSIIKLSEIGEVNMCKRIFSHQTSEQGSIPFYKIGTFGKEADAFISNDLFESYKIRFSYPRKGDVLISASGTIGRTLVYDGEKSYFQDSNIVWLKNDETVLLNKYLYQLFFMLKFDTEGSTIKRLYNNILLNVRIPLPPLKEQQAIAEVLSDMDRMISQTEALIEKKKAIKQGMMQELLRPKDGWVTKKLGIIATFHKGKGLPKSKINEFGRFKCIHYGELFTKYKENINNILSYTDENDNCCYSQINDVLMPTSDVTPNGLATASCVNEDGVILGGDILVIRLMPNILDGTFLAYFISQNKEIIMKLVTGSTVYHIYGSDLKDFEVSFPDISTQIEIIRAISDLETYVSFLELKNEKLKLQKQGMMQALLTGRIRLT